MIRRPFLQPIYICISIIAMLCIGCDRIPDATAPADPSLTVNPYERTYTPDTIMLFSPAYGNTSGFSGVRLCTLSTTGSAAVTVRNDSLACTITSLGDTTIALNGTTYGSASFVQSDVISWKLLHVYLLDTSSILGKLIAGQLSVADRDSILAADTLKPLPLTYKNSLTAALNKLLDLTNMFHDNRDELLWGIFFSKPQNMLKNDIAALIARGILLDTNGTVKPGISSVEKETIRWFNRDIIARYLDNEYLSIDNGAKGNVFSRFHACGRVFTVRFHLTDGTSTTDLLRFFELKNSVISLLAYQDAYGLHAVTKRKVQDIPYLCDVSWTVPHLLWPISVPFVDQQTILSLFSPGKAVVRYDGRDTTGTFLPFYTLKLYYSLSGNIFQNGKPVRLAGSVASSAGFFRDTSGMGMRTYAVFSSWNTEAEIFLTQDDGVRLRYKETTVLKPFRRRPCVARMTP